jgi:hypothetical protein
MPSFQVTQVLLLLLLALSPPSGRLPHPLKYGSAFGLCAEQKSRLRLGSRLMMKRTAALHRLHTPADSGTKTIEGRRIHLLLEFSSSWWEAEQHMLV